jgi:hypothetical protein
MLVRSGSVRFGTIFATELKCANQTNVRFHPEWTLTVTDQTGAKVLGLRVLANEPG